MSFEKVSSAGQAAFESSSNSLEVSGVNRVNEKISKDFGEGLEELKENENLPKVRESRLRTFSSNVSNSQPKSHNHSSFNLNFSKTKKNFSINLKGRFKGRKTSPAEIMESQNHVERLQNSPSGNNYHSESVTPGPGESRLKVNTSEETRNSLENENIINEDNEDDSFDFSADRFGNFEEKRPNSATNAAKLLLQRGRGLLNNSMNKAALTALTAGLSELVTAFNKTNNRFEQVEENLEKISKDCKKINSRVDENLSKMDQHSVLNFATLIRNFENSLLETRTSSLKDQFNLAFISVFMIAVVQMICILPLDVQLKCFAIMTVLTGLKIIGDSWISTKIELIRYNKLSEINLTSQMTNFSSRHESYQSITSEEEEPYKAQTFPPKRNRSVDNFQDSFCKTQGLKAESSEDKIEVEEHQTDNQPSNQDIEKPEDVNADEEVDYGLTFNYLDNSGLPFSLAFDKLSDKEKNIFTIFKPKVMDEIEACKDIDRSKPYDIPDDFNLLRFLQADDFDLKLARKRILSTVVWRQSFGATQYYRQAPKDLPLYRSLRKRIVIGRDLKHRPIVYEHIGEFFSNSLVPKGLPLESWLKCYTYESAELFREFRATSIENHDIIHHMIFVANMKGLQIRHSYKLSLISQMKNEVEVHFPECAGRIYLINAPSFMARIWKMVQKVLDPVVANKINIFSNVPTDLFIKEFGINSVPIEWGGKNAVSL